MIWETPAIVELRMDAEIGSYQEDTGPGDGPLFAARIEDTGAASRERRE